MDSLTNQEFLYRQNPVNYDGTGTITSIKGNTVKFNQLVQNGNFANTSNWALFGSLGTFTVQNNTAIFTHPDNDSARGIQQQNLPITVGSNHVYYLTFNITAIELSAKVRYPFESANNFSSLVQGKNSFIFTNPIATSLYIQAYRSYNLSKVMLTDLTSIFGSGNEPATPEAFETWLSNNIGLLPYYDYTLGTLIPFRGTGLKTVGFNQWDEVWENGILNINTGNKSSNANYIRSKNFIGVIPNKTYYLNFPQGDGGVCLYDGNYNFVRGMYYAGVSDKLLTIASNEKYLMFYNKNQTYGNDICININDTSKNGTYEPYTSSTLSLPISTYFPTGMKEAGSVYDEISDKAYTRVGSYTFTGSENFFTDGNTFATGIDSIIPIKINNTDTSANLSKAICDKFIVGTQTDVRNNSNYVGFSKWGTTKYLYFSNNELSYNDFKTWLTNNNTTIFFELETPTETDISPELDLTYPIWNGGTEQILPVNDSTPTTSAILCDIDYRGMIPVNATVDPTGAGTVEGTGDYRYHSMATLEATPSDEIYRFLRWEDENGDTVSTNRIYTFEVGE